MKRFWGLLRRWLRREYEAQCMIQGCHWHIGAFNTGKVIERGFQHSHMTGHSVAVGREYIERWGGYRWPA